MGTSLCVKHLASRIANAVAPRSVPIRGDNALSQRNRMDRRLRTHVCRTSRAGRRHRCHRGGGARHGGRAVRDRRGRPRGRFLDALVRRWARSSPAGRSGVRRARRTALHVDRGDRRGRSHVRRGESGRGVDRRRLLRRQPGARRPVRRALVGRGGSRPAGGASGVGLPHDVGQFRCAAAGRCHTGDTGPGAGGDSPSRGRLRARHHA